MTARAKKSAEAVPKKASTAKNKAAKKAAPKKKAAAKKAAPKKKAAAKKASSDDPPHKVVRPPEKPIVEIRKH